MTIARTLEAFPPSRTSGFERHAAYSCIDIIYHMVLQLLEIKSNLSCMAMGMSGARAEMGQAYGGGLHMHCTTSYTRFARQCPLGAFTTESSQVIDDIRRKCTVPLQACSLRNIEQASNKYLAMHYQFIIALLNCMRPFLTYKNHVWSIGLQLSTEKCGTGDQ